MKRRSMQIRAIGRPLQSKTKSSRVVLPTKIVYCQTCNSETKVRANFKRKSTCGCEDTELGDVIKFIYTSVNSLTIHSKLN